MIGERCQLTPQGTQHTMQEGSLFEMLHELA
jgi:hypothetical protein